jgi:hypothetical protein
LRLSVWLDATETGQAALETDLRSVLPVEGVSASAVLGLRAHLVEAGAPDVSGQTSNAAPKKSHMLIRRVEPADREQVRALMRQQHANRVFRQQPFSDRKFDAQFEFLSRHPENVLALVAEYRGNIVGAAWAQCDHYMLSDGPPFVAVQLIAVELEALNQVGRTKVFLGLIAAVRQWKTEKGASHVQVNVTTGTNLSATDKLLRAVGAEFVGGSYVV